MSKIDLRLIAALIRNFRSSSINKDMAGHKITRVIGPVTSEEILSYVDATLDDPARYKNTNSPVPPFYLSKLLYPMFRYFLVHPDLHLNLLRLVHGFQSVEWIGLLRIGDTVRVEMTIDRITESPAGEIINLKTELFSGEEKIGEAVTGFIVRNTVKTRKIRITEDTPPEEIFRKSFHTAKGQNLKYAEVSGDNNFIHTSNFFARLAGLPGTIIHGVCIAAMTANCLLDEVLGGDMLRMRKMSLRFASPVLPGDEVTVVGYESGSRDRILFSAFNSSGKQVLKNGEYIFSGEVD